MVHAPEQRPGRPRLCFSGMLGELVWYTSRQDPPWSHASPAGEYAMSLLPTDTVLHHLGAVPYFAGLDAPRLKALAAQCHMQRLDVDESILLEGEPAKGLYIVLSGKVRVFKSSPDGREQVLIVVGPGETFNDVPVFDGGPSPASADAVGTGTDVCLVPTSVVAQLLATVPVVAASVTKVLASRLRHLTMLVEDLDRKS